MDPEVSNQVTDYIKANRARYTHEAVREQLIMAGYEPAQVDAAWELEVGSQPGGSAGGGVVAFARVLFIIAALLGAVGGLSLSSGSLGYPKPASLPIFWGTFAITYLAVGYGIIRLLRWAVRRFSIRSAWAALVGLALIPIYGAFMLGTCLGAFSLSR